MPTRPKGAQSTASRGIVAEINGSAAERYRIKASRTTSRRGATSQQLDRRHKHATAVKAQIPLRRLSPKLPHGESSGHKLRKSQTQTISTCLDVCDKVRDEVREQVLDKVADLSRTQIIKIGDVICVADFHDLCPRQVRDFVGNLSRTLSQSRRNGIWASTSAAARYCCCITRK